MHYKTGDCTGACFYRGTLKVDQPGDTFLDTSNFVKGFVWVNGHALGRIWDVGPQKTLYLPGPWLRKGSNDVIVFDEEGAAGRTIEGKAAPSPEWHRDSALAALGWSCEALIPRRYFCGSQSSVMT
jgi:beta-galactosidase